MLWCFADEHIREDDHIECTADEVNEAVGFADFCALLPPDWFQILDANCVHLPHFLEHTGIEAKRRAVDQMRQQRHRAKRNASVTTVSRASRDQTETETETIEKETSLRDAKKAPAAQSPATGSRLPEDWKPTPDFEAYARQYGLDPARIAENFRDYWIAQAGARGRKANWTATWRTWCRRESETRPTNGNGRPKPRDEAALAEAESHARAIGFRQKAEHESVTAYGQALKTWENTRRATPNGEAGSRIAALATRLRSMSS